MGQFKLSEEDIKSLNMMDALNFGMFEKSLKEVHESDYQFLPSGGGMFQITKPHDKSRKIVFTPQLLNTNDQPYPVDLLERLYAHNENCDILYQEWANDVDGIRNAVRRFIEYGWNEYQAHKKGRAIWQIVQPEVLNLRYFPEHYDDSETLHRFSMIYLKDMYGSYPLANEADLILSSN